MSENRLGIVGGGQLGRMLTEAAKPMGFEVTVIDPGAECPAYQAGAEQIEAALTDGDAVSELADRVDVVTWEIEHINTDSLVDLPVRVEPSPQTLATIKDKLTQKRYLNDHGIPVAEFDAIDDEQSFDEIFSRFGAVIVKTRFGGYDGRGNQVVSGPDWQQVLTRFGEQPIYAERIVPFQKELSVVVARDRNGSVLPYPVVETIHADNICNMVLSPPDIAPVIQTDAEEIARETVRHLEGAGIFAIEMFLTEQDEILVNEIAPRVHNSGHHTIEANVTSQFEQHVRAVMGLPLGKVDRLSAAVMINILGERDGPVEVDGIDRVLSIPDAHLHLYGKAPTKRARKMGHITVLAGTVDEAKELAIKAREEFEI